MTHLHLKEAFLHSLMEQNSILSKDRVKDLLSDSERRENAQGCPGLP